MSTPLQLSIPQPCDASWDQMTPEEKSRHCNFCSQAVYELEEFEEVEVVALLQQKVCVRIKANAEGKIKTRSGFSSFLLLGGLLACGDGTGEPVLEVEQEVPVEVLQVTAGQPVQVERHEVKSVEPPVPVMGKIAAPVRSQAESIEMGEVEMVHQDYGDPIQTTSKKSTQASKEDCLTEPNDAQQVSP